MRTEMMLPAANKEQPLMETISFFGHQSIKNQDQLYIGETMKEVCVCVCVTYHPNKETRFCHVNLQTNKQDSGLERLIIFFSCAHLCC